MSIPVAFEAAWVLATLIFNSFGYNAIQMIE